MSSASTPWMESGVIRDCIDTIKAGIELAFLEDQLPGFLGCERAGISRRKSSDHGERSTVKAPEYLQGKYVWEKLDYVSLAFIIVVHSVPVYGFFYHFISTPWQTWVWAILYYAIGALGITAGYHRFWSHRSYQATIPLRVLLMVMGSTALQGSIKWWSRLHRAHHRWTDTNKDPYDSRRGFFFAHMGWLFYKKERVASDVCVKDLKAQKVVEWQNRNYKWFGPFVAFFVPGLVAALWGDFWGGFIWAGYFRLCLLYHATWSINSIAHYIGDTPFDDTLTPRDSWFTALVTMGEGYHNFHHEFPGDYRNAIEWYQYDPTKWFILFMKWLGFAYDLRSFPSNEIERGRILMEQKKLNARRAQLNHGKPVATLPIWTKEVIDKAAKEKILIVIENVVHDLNGFEKRHPGGENILRAYNGKDATKAFNGAVYNHTNAARNLMSHMRVARTTADAAAGDGGKNQ